MLKASFPEQTLPLALGAVLLSIMWLPHAPIITNAFAAVYREVFHSIQFATAIDPASTPSITTYLAIWVGRLTQSTLLGLHLSWLIGVTVFWALILLITWSLSPRAAVLSNLFLIMTTWGVQKLIGYSPWDYALSRYYQTDQFFYQGFIFSVVLVCLLVDYMSRLRWITILVFFFGLYTLREADHIYATQLYGVMFVSLSVWVLKKLNNYRLSTSVCVVAYLTILTASAGLYVWFRPDYFIKTTLIDLSVIWSCVVAGLVCDVVWSRWIWPIEQQRRRSNLVIIGTPIMALYFLVSSVIPATTEFDVRIAARTDKALMSIQRMSEIDNPKKTNWMISPLASLPNSVPHLFNYALANIPFTFTTEEQHPLAELAQKDLFHWLIIDNRQDVPFFFASCIQARMEPLTAYKSDCIARAWKEQNSCSGTFNLTKGGHAIGRMFYGLSQPEDHGRWTDGNIVLLACIVRGTPPRRIELSVGAFTHGALTSQGIIARVNNGSAQTFRISKPEKIYLDLPQLNDGGLVTVEIQLPDAASPRSVGFNSDSRKLAINLKTIGFLTD
jgi:hypothetical protein